MSYKRLALALARKVTILLVNNLLAIFLSKIQRAPFKKYRYLLARVDDVLVFGILITAYSVTLSTSWKHDARTREPNPADYEIEGFFSIFFFKLN